MKPAEEAGPAARGFSLPAEWERHEATWLGWPHQTADWPGKFSAIPWVYGEIVRNIAPGERLRVVVQDAAHERRARRVLEKTGLAGGAIDFFRWPMDRGWLRDAGPAFVRRGGPGGERAIVDFHFNAWAKYPNWRRDRLLPRRASRKLGRRLFNATLNGRPFVLEGGALDVNGRGTLITTEECLLDPAVQVRNPGWSRAEIEEALRRNLGVTTILWLGKGIDGDDTHGHVDDLCRFVSEDTLVLCQEKNPRDANYRPLAENMERVQSFRLEKGKRASVVPLPMPAPVLFEGRRLPASYANFYIANAAVLVPTFNDANDRRALGILSELFKDRPVIGIHAVDLVWGLGTLHCLTREEPA